LSRWYLDTSAALKLMVDEAESEALARALDAAAPDIVACWLLDTELRRAAHRVPALTQDAVTTFLEGVDVYEMPGSLYREAGLLAGADLRSLDALHIAAAVRLGVDHLVTYDRRMERSARALGVSVLAPG
jgi:predicted nucleic acid-binding protein